MEKRVFSKNGAGTPGYPIGNKVNLNLCFYPYTEINPKWITELKAKA